MWRMTKVGARVIIAQDDVAFADISSQRLFTALPQATAEALPGKVRVATNAGMTDVPLKGSIDANVSEEARIERAIDQMVQSGAAEAGVYLSEAPAPQPGCVARAVGGK